MSVTEYTPLDFYSIKRNLEALASIKRPRVPYTNATKNLIEVHKGFTYSKKRRNFHTCVVERTFEAAFKAIEEVSELEDPRSPKKIQAEEIKELLRPALRGFRRIAFRINLQDRSAGLDLRKQHQNLKKSYRDLTKKQTILESRIAASSQSTFFLAEARKLLDDVDTIRFCSKRPSVARNKGKMDNELQQRLQQIRNQGVVDPEDLRQWEEAMAQQKKEKANASSTRFAFINSPLFKKLGGTMSTAGAAKVVPKRFFRRTREVSPYIYEERPQLQRQTSNLHFVRTQAQPSKPEMRRACSELFDPDFIKHLQKRRRVVGI